MNWPDDLSLVFHLPSFTDKVWINLFSGILQRCLRFEPGSESEHANQPLTHSYVHYEKLPMFIEVIVRVTS